MDFSLTTVFVVPTGSTLATTGKSNNLTAGQLGLFKRDGSIATAGDTTATIRIAQGRNADEMTTLSKKSDYMNRNNIVFYDKNIARTTATPQIVEVSDFSIHCGETVSLTIRAMSRDLNISYYGGLTETFTLVTPCCDCGDDNCSELDPETLVDNFVAKINASRFKDYMTASRTSSGASSVLVITGKIPEALPTYYNPQATPYAYDMITFGVFPYKGAATTMDMILNDRCDPFAEVDVTQTPSFPIGSSAEVAAIERQYWSYQTAQGKDQFFTHPEYNLGFSSNVSPGTWYDEIVIKFKNLDGVHTWTPDLSLDSTVRIFVPTGTYTAIDTVLNAILGTSPIRNDY